MNKRISLLLLLSLILASCRSYINEYQFTISHAGFSVDVTYETTSEDLSNDTIQPVLQAHLAKLHDDYASNVSNSWVSQFNQAENSDQLTVPSEFSAILRMTKLISDTADGCFSIASSWPDDMNKRSDVSETNVAKEVFLAYGGFVRKIDPAAKIDLAPLFNSIVSESIADQLSAKGINNFKVSAKQVEIISGKYKATDVMFEKAQSHAFVEAKKLTQGNFNKIAAASSNQDSRMELTDREQSRFPAVIVYHDDAVRAQIWANALACLSPEQRQLVARGNNIQAVFEETSEQG
ncbi:FAD:protein FMN transferase [Alteromonas ponticola]|uniref:FAD:protein FMN transferase n=1 Tax=Alteromonas ponticola TaxID=2720613 RepID=A0ABX1QX52_9ALTE|nr:FAD:protein FMN transferase [Alteromonas ponticola]NMH58830.1 FAD:protein FMN transferase [Alteromonas ponticola]